MGNINSVQLEKLIRISVIISIIAALVAGVSAVISCLALNQTLKEDTYLKTRNEIHQFDFKWVGGTNNCIAYLLSLDDEQKKLAFTGKSHSLSVNNKSTLSSCLPRYADEISNISSSNGNMSVNSKYAYEAKETVRRSLNALDLLIGSFDEIDKCQAWVLINGIFEKETTQKIAYEWPKYTKCSRCYTTLQGMYEQGKMYELNQVCLSQ